MGAPCEACLRQIKDPPRRRREHGRMNKPAFVTTLLVVAASLGGCAIQWRNTEPAREVARAAEPPGSAYAGWRVYQQRCAGCHGGGADGSGGAPNLLLRLQGLGPQRFVDLVLRRYEADMLPPGQGSPREALVDEVVERRRGELSMPAWQGEPVVNAHVMDLYAYLSARSEGRIGTGRPAAR
jgi:mono/diheme cytochrome c family protein